MDPESALACQLYATLQVLASANTSILGSGGSGSSSTKLIGSVQCIYANNPTSSTILCNLWCQIQAQYGQVCQNSSSSGTTTAAICPYQSDPKYVLACQMYQYLLLMQGSSSASGICPYAPDPEHILACQLYERLVQLQVASSIGTGVLQALLSTNVFKGSILGSGNFLNCIYSNNPTSSNLLCYLYCQIQQFYNLNCSDGPTSLSWSPATTKNPCPFSSDPESILACSMYYLLLELQKASSSGSASLYSLLALNTFKGSGSGSGGLTTCTYNSNPTSANLLCYLFCMIQPYYGQQCQNVPSSLSWKPTTSQPTLNCPYISDPENVLACSLYNTLSQLQNYSSGSSTLNLNIHKGSSSGSGGFVNCTYVSNPTSANLLCYLFCSIQPFYGQQCLNGPTSLSWTQTTTVNINSCPFSSDPESVLACSLYQRLLQLQKASSTDSSAFNSVLNLNIFKGSGSGSGGFINCTYASNPTSANLLCYLYCMIQPFYSQQCFNGPISLSWTQTTVANTNSCPFSSDPENVLVCSLYQRLLQLQTSSSTDPSAFSSVLNLNIYKGSGSGSEGYVNCTYSSNPTSANLLCYLFCLIQPFYGQQCLNGPTSLSWHPTTSSTINLCPYSSDPENITACLLYYRLKKLQEAAIMGSSFLASAIAENSFKGSGTSSGAYVDCVYSSNPTSSNLLCSLYCLIQPYYGLQCKTSSTSLNWNSATSTAQPSIIECIYSNDTTSSALLCSSTLPYVTSASPSCPYISDPQATVACQMYMLILQQNKASLNGSSGVSSWIEGNAFKGSGSGSTVGCPY